jgi:hypothetical protein
LSQIEDEGNHGNDETRSFILSSLAAQNQSRVNCVLCSDVMLVFDRYPLVDGTFFLSPKQYNKNAVEVNILSMNNIGTRDLLVNNNIESVLADRF